MFQKCFKVVSGKCQGCSKKVFRVFQVRLKGNPRSFKGVLMVFESSLKSVSGMFQWCFNGVPRKFQKLLRKFQECLKKI